MEIVTISDAKARLSQLVDIAAAGEDIVVSRNGKPLVRITRLEAPKRRITFGLLEGRLTVPGDFDAPLPDEVLADYANLVQLSDAFEGLQSVACGEVLDEDELDRLFEEPLTKRTTA